MQPILITAVITWWLSWFQAAISLWYIVALRKQTKASQYLIILVSVTIAVAIVCTFAPIFAWNDNCLADWERLLQQTYVDVKVVRELGYTFSLGIAYASLVCLVICLAVAWMFING